MFKTEIKSTALTLPAADECFNGRITTDAYRSDVSMAALCRTLFDKRLGEKETVMVKHEVLGFTGNDSLDRIEGLAAGLPTGCVSIVSIFSRDEDSGKWMKDTKERLEKTGLHELTTLEAWFAKTDTKILIYTDQPVDPKNPKSPVDNTKTFIVIENMSTQRWHLIAALIPRFLAKWFKDNPLTETEAKDLCNALIGETPDKFLQTVAKYAETYDFRGMAIRRMLGDFETKYEKERAAQLEEKAKRYDRDIKELMQRIGDLLQQKDDNLAMLMGYQERSKDVEPLTMKYFLAAKNLFLKNVTGDYLDFYAWAWLSNWDPAKAKSTFAKDHCSSWLESNNKFGVSDDDAKLLYKAIFLDETVKVRLWSHFKLHLRGDDPMHVFSDNCCPEITNALPNPHHHYNSCGGSNRQRVAERIAERDIIGAIEQCTSATSGINLMEHASYQFFAKDVFDPAFGEIIYVKELEKFMTTLDAINYLKERYGKEEKEEA